ncbi:MFS transporter [Paludibacter jiangxiensis]|uniref:Predicted arabinose efflux permease, MFS family n=1 Tax=Paludibacter jiangxiensis TaxID=681398 RepID=A0A161LDM6_9BACT|nr:MFS transporter [Paludibacter jiangxiensis]GAT62097.1 predicted arabinose efflux permease, MFS family [Paludibacter jiangxiensis]
MNPKKLFSNEAFDVLKIDNVRYFLTYRFVMTCATMMQSIVIGWQVYSLTKNVLLLGVIGLVEAVPQVGIALFAGHFADIWDRKKIIQYTTILLLVGAGILLAYSVPELDCYTRFGIFPMFITIFLTGFVRGVLMPAHTAFLGQIVPRDKLTSAATWNSTNWQLAAVIGPAFGGLLYGFSGVVPAYSGVFILYAFAIYLISRVKSQRVAPVINTDENIFERISVGVRYVFKNQVLLGAFSLDMFAVLFGDAVALLPVFASDILKTGPEGLGVLRAAPAVGAILMSVYLAFNPPVNRSGRKLLWCVAGFGLAIIAFALSRNFYLSAFLLLLSGSFDNMSVVVRGSILQLYTPDEVRGRVAAVNSIFIGSSNEIGTFESGLTAKYMGTIPSVIFGGCMTLLIVGIASRKAPKLRKLELKDAV